MVLRYEAAGGTPVQQRDARLAHRIVIPAADKAAGLAKMAPQVFSLDAAGDATCDIGQITSLLLASVASLPPAGYPAKTFKHWRIKVEAISRLRTTPALRSSHSGLTTSSPRCTSPPTGPLGSAGRLSALCTRCAPSTRARRSWLLSRSKRLTSSASTLATSALLNLELCSAVPYGSPMTPRGIHAAHPHRMRTALPP